MSEHIIHLVGGKGDETATVFAKASDGLCHITLCHGGGEIVGAAHDYFEAFSQVRLQLEKDRLTPFCYGASLNVFPSGMCRDMGAGMTAYRLKLGKHPNQDDLVRIFDEGPDVIPAPVAVQREYFNDWAKSLPGPQVRRRTYGFHLQPIHTLILSPIVCLLCAWTFLVTIRGWPISWARPTFLATIFLAPALPVACFFQLREHRFSWLLLTATLFSLTAVTLLGLSFYIRAQS